MIANIIEESYHKKNIPKKKISFNYSEPKVPFHQMEVENLNLNYSTSINCKVKKNEKKIYDDMDELQVFSLIEEDKNTTNSNNNNNNNKNNNNYYSKNNQVKSPMQLIKKKPKQSKYLFKGDMLMSDKINKTKIKEFSFSKTTKNKFKLHPALYLKKKQKNLFIKNKNKIKNKSKSKSNNKSKNNINNKISPFQPLSAKSTYISPSKFYNISNSDCFFITKLPSYFYKNNNIKSKEKKLKRMKKIIRETNSNMLDIYTGLKNMKQNKFSTYDDPLSYNRKNKSKNGFRNTDRIIGMQKSQSVSYINRKFKKLFRDIFDTKKFSNEKLDARTLLDPLDKIAGGTYKEVKLDNIINNKIGQRIWIKKSTANIVSYGKSFQLLSDDIFYKERKRIIGIYPKIEKEAEIFIPRKKIEKRHPLIDKLKENVHKINNVFLKEYKLLNRAKRKYS